MVKKTASCPAPVPIDPYFNPDEDWQLEMSSSAELVFERGNRHYLQLVIRFERPGRNGVDIPLIGWLSRTAEVPTVPKVTITHASDMDCMLSTTIGRTEFVAVIAWDIVDPFVEDLDAIVTGEEADDDTVNDEVRALISPQTTLAAAPIQ